MKVCIVGASGHGSFVFRAMEQDPSIKVVGVAPGSEGEDASKMSENGRKARPICQTI